MLTLKKVYRDELLQFALLLSLLRVNPEYYFEQDLFSSISDLDFDNGTSWRSFATSTLRPHYVHPKNLDSVLLNYERELFADLNSLGRYNPVQSFHHNQNITAFLLSVDRTPALNCTPATTEQHASEQPLVQQSPTESESLAASDNEAAAASFDFDLGLTQEVLH